MAQERNLNQDLSIIDLENGDLISEFINVIDQVVQHEMSVDSQITFVDSEGIMYHLVDRPQIDSSINLVRKEIRFGRNEHLSYDMVDDELNLIYDGHELSIDKNSSYQEKINFLFKSMEIIKLTPFEERSVLNVLNSSMLISPNNVPSVVIDNAIENLYQLEDMGVKSVYSKENELQLEDISWGAPEKAHFGVVANHYQRNYPEFVSLNENVDGQEFVLNLTNGISYSYDSNRGNKQIYTKKEFGIVTEHRMDVDVFNDELSSQLNLILNYPIYQANKDKLYDIYIDSIYARGNLLPKRNNELLLINGYSNLLNVSVEKTSNYHIVELIGSDGPTVRSSSYRIELPNQIELNHDSFLNSLELIEKGDSVSYTKNTWYDFVKELNQSVGLTEKQENKLMNDLAIHGLFDKDILKTPEIESSLIQYIELAANQSIESMVAEKNVSNKIEDNLVNERDKIVSLYAKHAEGKGLTYTERSSIVKYDQNNSAFEQMNMRLDGIAQAKFNSGVIEGLSNLESMIESTRGNSASMSEIISKEYYQMSIHEIPESEKSLKDDTKTISKNGAKARELVIGPDDKVYVLSADDKVVVPHEQKVPSVVNAVYLRKNKVMQIQFNSHSELSSFIDTRMDKPHELEGSLQNQNISHEEDQSREKHTSLSRDQDTRVSAKKDSGRSM